MFAGFARRIVDEDAHSLTLRLAGTFRPTEELNCESVRAQHVVGQLFERTMAPACDARTFGRRPRAHLRPGPRSTFAEVIERFEQGADPG